MVSLDGSLRVLPLSAQHLREYARVAHCCDACFAPVHIYLILICCCNADFCRPLGAPPFQVARTTLTRDEVFPSPSQDWLSPQHLPLMNVQPWSYPYRLLMRTWIKVIRDGEWMPSWRQATPSFGRCQGEFVALSNSNLQSCIKILFKFMVYFMTQLEWNTTL